MPYDIVSCNDVISALSSRVPEKCAFYWCIDIGQFFSQTHRLAKLFECLSYNMPTERSAYPTLLFRELLENSVYLGVSQKNLI